MTLHPSRDVVAWVVVVACLGALAWMRVTRSDAGEAAFPARSISIICPYAAGGGTDLLARGLARAAEREIGRTITVNNVTGGAGAVGFAAGLLAPPDGYTVTVVTFELVSLPLQGLVPFQPDDFDLLMRVNMDPAALTVRADCPADTVEEFIEWARSRGGVQVGNSGPGSVWHLAGAQLAEALEIPATHVPFGGAAPAVTALVGGHIDAVTVSPGEARIQVEAGLLKILGVMAEHRLAMAAGAPTFREVGFPLVFGTWRGLALPRGVPPGIRGRLAAVFRAAMDTPEFTEFARRGSLILDYADAETFLRAVDAQGREVAVLMDRLGLR